MQAQAKLQKNNGHSEKLTQVFFERFSYDSSRYLVPRMPFSDRYNRRRIIDYAVISHDPSMPRVAILIRTGKAERSQGQQEDLDRSIEVLTEQGWETIVFSPEDIVFRPRHVRMILDDIFAGKIQSDDQADLPFKKDYFSWLLYLMPFKRFKNIEVVVFTSIFTLLLTFSVTTSLHDNASSTINIEKPTFTAENEVDYLIMNGENEEEKKTADSPWRKSLNIKANSSKDTPYQGKKIVPVINLDKAMPEDTADKEQKREKKKKDAPNVADPIYLGTVRFCNTGLECQLKNDTRIILWGVKLPEDPIQQSTSMAMLNQMVAGRVLKLEPKEMHSDYMLVKATLGKDDVAMAQVEKGLLLPAYETTDVYRHINKPIKQQ